MDSGKPSSSAGDVQHSAGRHRLVSVRGRMGHVPCVDVPGERTLLSTSAGKELAGESSGLTVKRS